MGTIILVVAGIAVVFFFYSIFAAKATVSRVEQSAGSNLDDWKRQKQEEIEREAREKAYELKQQDQARAQAAQDRRQAEDRARQEQDARRRAEEDRRAEYIRAFPDKVMSILAEFKEYSLNLSNQLNTLVDEGKITGSDRRILVQKVEEEIDHLRTFLYERRDAMANTYAEPTREAATEVNTLRRLQKYHDGFLDELQRINSLGITESQERVVRKQRAEDEYNTVRADVYPFVKREYSHYFKQMAEDDEIYVSKRNTSKQYYGG